MSYLEQFNLQREPFSFSPDPDMFYQSRSRVDCLRHVTVAIRLHRGLNVVIGGVGSGKTTLCRVLVRELAHFKGIDVCLILNADFAGRRDFLLHLARLLGLAEAETSGEPDEVMARIRANLIEHYQVRHRIVCLLIDEGQVMTPECFGILEELSDIPIPEGKLLQTVIFGQNEFLGLLADHPSLFNKINYLNVLKPFSFFETKAMVESRLQEAAIEDRPRPRFSWPALIYLHWKSGGFPRKIVHLCHRALVGTFGGGETIRLAHVMQSAQSHLFMAKLNAVWVKRALACTLVLALAAIVYAASSFWPNSPTHPERATQAPRLTQQMPTPGSMESKPEQTPPNEKGAPAPEQNQSPQASAEPASSPARKPGAKPVELPARQAQTKPAEAEIISPGAKPAKIAVPAMPEQPAQTAATPAGPETSAKTTQIAPVATPTAPQAQAQAQGQGQGQAQGQAQAQAQAQTVTPPALLGQVKLKAGWMFAKCLEDVYGRRDLSVIKTLAKANPGLTPIYNAGPGALVTFPAVTAPAPPEGAAFLSLKRAENLSQALEFIADHAAPKKPLRVFSVFNAAEGLRLEVILPYTFPDSGAAERYKAALPAELAGEARVVSGFAPDTTYFSPAPALAPPPGPPAQIDSQAAPQVAPVATTPALLGQVKLKPGRIFARRQEDVYGRRDKDVLAALAKANPDIARIFDAGPGAVVNFPAVPAAAPPEGAAFLSLKRFENLAQALDFIAASAQAKKPLRVFATFGVAQGLRLDVIEPFTFPDSRSAERAKAALPPEAAGEATILTGFAPDTVFYSLSPPAAEPVPPAPAVAPFGRGAEQAIPEPSPASSAPAPTPAPGSPEPQAALQPPVASSAPKAPEPAAESQRTPAPQFVAQQVEPATLFKTPQPPVETPKPPEIPAANPKAVEPPAPAKTSQPEAQPEASPMTPSPASSAAPSAENADRSPALAPAPIPTPSTTPIPTPAPTPAAAPAATPPALLGQVKLKPGWVFARRQEDVYGRRDKQVLAALAKANPGLAHIFDAGPGAVVNFPAAPAAAPPKNAAFLSLTRAANLAQALDFIVAHEEGKKSPRLFATFGPAEGLRLEVILPYTFPDSGAAERAKSALTAELAGQARVIADFAPDTVFYSLSPPVAEQIAPREPASLPAAVSTPTAPPPGPVTPSPAPDAARQTSIYALPQAAPTAVLPPDIRPDVGRPSTSSPASDATLVSPQTEPGMLGSAKLMPGWALWRRIDDLYGRRDKEIFEAVVKANPGMVSVPEATPASLVNYPAVATAAPPPASAYIALGKPGSLASAFERVIAGAGEKWPLRIFATKIPGHEPIFEVIVSRSFASAEAAAQALAGLPPDLAGQGRVISGFAPDTIFYSSASVAPRSKSTAAERPEIKTGPASMPAPERTPIPYRPGIE